MKETTMDHKEHEEKPWRRDMFLEGNEQIEMAIDRFHADTSRENLMALLDVIRKRMHEDGHFIFPVIISEGNDTEYAFQSIQTKDGRIWHVAFTSAEQYELGEQSEVLSHFIDDMLKNSLKTNAAGFVINPWGQSFLLTKDLIETIFQADGDVEYAVPDDTITEELLEDGSYLKRAVGICRRNRTMMNMMKLARILRDSLVWVPCTAVFSDADNEAFRRSIQDTLEKGDTDSLVGQTFTSEDEIRMVPDILQNRDDYFFPVFTTVEEMGDYGKRFSTLQCHFLEAANLARNNEKQVKGIVINAFTEPFEISVELFDVIAGMESVIKEKAGESDE